jgi:hypothetical protein
MARFAPRDDGLGLHLDAAEVQVLASLARGLQERVSAARTRPDLTDEALAPLLPPASRGDEAVDAELRGLLRDELLSGREDRLGAFIALLEADGAASDGLDVTFDRDVAMRTVEALNDLRLALAATAPQLRAADDGAEADTARLLDALAWLQGGLIEFIDPP